MKHYGKKIFSSHPMSVLSVGPVQTIRTNFDQLMSIIYIFLDSAFLSQNRAIAGPDEKDSQGGLNFQEP